LGVATPDDENGNDDNDGDDGHDVNQDKEFGKAPGIGYFIGVQMRDDLNTRVVLSKIEPAADTKRSLEIVYKISRAVLEDQ